MPWRKDTYTGWKDRKPVAQGLRPIYGAASEQEARMALQAFAEGQWGAKHPTIVQPRPKAALRSAVFSPMLYLPRTPLQSNQYPRR